MAIQKGSINLEGQIGDLSFYESNGKPLVRQRSGVSKARIANDPNFARTRENNVEFGRGSRVVLPQNLPLRYGFSFNAVAALKDVLFIPPSYTYRGDSGVLEVSLPALWPDAAMAAPDNAEFCSFHIAALSFRADYEWLPFAVHHHELIPIGYQAIPPQAFGLELPAASPDPVIICFGLSFYKKLGGYPTPIMKSSRNVFEVVGVVNTSYPEVQN